MRGVESAIVDPGIRQSGGVLSLGPSIWHCLAKGGTGLIGLPPVLAISGPFLTAVGAVLLARDAIRGPVAWYSHDFFGTRPWELLRQDHDRNLKLLAELPSPPYTPEAIKRLVDNAEAQFKALE